MALILVIDDEPQVLDMVERLLKSAGHEVIQAEDGLQALKRQRERPADLVVTDLFMPNQEGLETIIHFRNLFPEVPIIAMSGKPAGPTMLSIAQKLGTVAVFQKPFNAAEMLKAVAKALPEQSS